MARPLRIEYPSAVYHITARGNAKQSIFLDDAGRRSFLDLLAAVVDRHKWLCHAYCLMGNHYHLLLETPNANLSQGMRELNCVYAQQFNRQHDRVGHVLQGRFKSILVDRDNYLLELTRYVVLNPVRAGMVSDPVDWEWSSYRATLGLCPEPSFLTVDWVLARFGSIKREAQLAYRQFVSEGHSKNVWGDLRGSVVLGSEVFAESIATELQNRRGYEEVPKVDRFAIRPSLDDLFEKSPDDRQARNAKIYEAYTEHGYTLTQIGKHLNRHYSTISKIVTQQRKKRVKSHDSRSDPF